MFSFSFFPSNFPVFAITLLATLVLGTIIYRLFFHPLAGVPGPRLAAISTLWLAYHARKARNHVFMPELHRRYGKVVRIAPGQVMVCSEDAIKQMYSAGSFFIKGSWYQVCAAPDSKRKGDNRFDLLTEMDKDRYRYQRRAIGPAYSIKGMEKHEDLLNTSITHFVSKLQTLDSQWIKLSEWMHIFVLDALSTVTFSKSLDYILQGNDGGNMDGSDKHWAYFTVVGLFPWLVNLTQSIPKIGMYLMIPIALAFGLPIPTGLPIFKFCVPNIMERLGKLESTAGVGLPADRPGLVLSEGAKEASEEREEVDVGEEKDLLASLMKLHHDKEARFHPAWVLGIALTNFGAGHDTMTITLSATLHLIARHPEVRNRLQREFKEKGIARESSYAEIVREVPYLWAVVKESMRLYPAIAFIMPRVVPSTGAEMAGTYLPAGTTASVSLYATQHDPSMFPEPEKFMPDRWLLDGTDEKKREVGRMDGLWMGFGGGSRSCPGQYLARFFVIKVLTRLLLEFDVEVRGEPELKGWFSAHFYGVDVRFREKV